MMRGSQFFMGKYVKTKYSILLKNEIKNDFFPSLIKHCTPIFVSQLLPQSYHQYFFTC